MPRGGRSSHRRRLVLLLVSLSLLSGCGTAVVPTGGESPTPRSTSASAADDLFRLDVATDRPAYRPGDAITVTTTLTYIGPADVFMPSGSGSGLVGFSVRQLDGSRHTDATWTADCAEHPAMSRGVPVAMTFTKSGGFSPTDPDAAFWTQYFADPLLQLPAGHWEIEAQADVSGPGCTPPDDQLTATVEITVEP